MKRAGRGVENAEVIGEAGRCQNLLGEVRTCKDRLGDLDRVRREKKGGFL